MARGNRRNFRDLADDLKIHPFSVYRAGRAPTRCGSNGPFDTSTGSEIRIQTPRTSARPVAAIERAQRDPGGEATRAFSGIGQTLPVRETKQPGLCSLPRGGPPQPLGATNVHQSQAPQVRPLPPCTCRPVQLVLPDRLAQQLTGTISGPGSGLWQCRRRQCRADGD
jgi:hypothetical protein